MATDHILSAPLRPLAKLVCGKQARNNIVAASKPLIFGIVSNNKIACKVPSSLRRSANYKPCIWDYNYLQSLKNDYSGDMYKRRAEKLRGDVKMIFENLAAEPELNHFELIDDLQRLGVAYHFEDHIKNLLDNLYHKRNTYKEKESNLYATALEFRLFRQHGYYISQDTFTSFTDDKGSFKAYLREDVRGMLSLYEASYLLMEGESLLKEAWQFTAECLKDLRGNVEPSLATEVREALDIPLHWRSPRLQVRSFIDVYGKRFGMNPLLLEIAKLDFNLLQGLHQEELRNQSRWWKNLGLGKKMDFARDRLVESFVWSVGTSSEPQFELCRAVVTKAIALITVIDDVYDVYGTMDELELFTEAVERWDINKIERLPDYMKTCFSALYNFVNEIVYEVLKEQDLNVLPYLKKAWVDLLKSYLVEARWYNSGHTPTFEEYMRNGWISIATPVTLVHAYILGTNSLEKEALEFLESKPDILYCAAFIFRLCDDHGTSTDEIKRGDVPKSIQCYMKETGVSEEVAREHMRDLILVTWEKVNLYSVSESPLCRSFVGTMLNLVRTAHSMYHKGDGHGVQDAQSADRVTSLLFQSIPL